MKKYFLPLFIIALVPKAVSAHCPLCTAGAGALAILAASFGVSSVVVGVFVGAFSLALGLWLSSTVKKEYVRLQKLILATLIFLGTVVPIMPFIEHYAPFYVPFVGKYGTTYVINLYILGVVIGAIVMSTSPYISVFVTKIRNRHMPFQGIVITGILLVVISAIIQLLS